MLPMFIISSVLAGLCISLGNVRLNALDGVNYSLTTVLASTTIFLQLKLRNEHWSTPTLSVKAIHWYVLHSTCVIIFLSSYWTCQCAAPRTTVLLWTCCSSSLTSSMVARVTDENLFSGNRGSVLIGVPSDRNVWYNTRDCVICLPAVT